MFKYFDFKKAEAIQVKQTFNAVFVEGVVPAVGAGGTSSVTISISNRGDLITENVTGKYSTLVSDGGDPAAAVDDGTNHLSCKITSQSTGNNLFERFTPLDLWCTPGRVRTPGIYLDAAGGVPDPSSQLIFPKALQYIWKSSDVIELEFKNDSDWQNSFAIAFWGTRQLNGSDKTVN